MSIAPGSAASLLPASRVQSALAAVLRPVQPSPFELLWASHPAWPAAATGRAGEDDEPATIACLDSSFNPPTVGGRVDQGEGGRNMADQRTPGQNRRRTRP